MKKMTIDGNTAASHVAYAFSEVAAIYPITPSSPMAEYADEWASKGQTNLWGQKVRIAEMQSEGGAAGAVHGSLVAGALTSTFTASQGLLLMIPNMYKIAGELLPCVFHVSARALAYSALNIFGDHSDVMACRQTGYAMLCANSVQEVMDLSCVAHLATLKSSVPFLHFFDGFRTSHEISKIDGIEYEEMAKMFDPEDVKKFKERALNPEHPVQMGTAQNPDIYFQGREAANKYYEAVPEIVKTMMKKVETATGRKYNLFDYVGAPDAENVIVMMGSGAEAAEEAVKLFNKQKRKVGLVKVRLYRPFSIKDFVSVLPKTVKKIAVLDRTKESGSLGEPMYLDVVAALNEQGVKNVTVIGGRYGLGSKEFNPTHVNAIFKNLESKKPINHFTVGINDDVTHTSLDMSEFVNASPEGTIRCKFFGLGSDGTVGANKNSIKIIGDHTDMYAQGYFAYDSKKSGGITISHLRFGKTPIQSTYLIDQADFVACHNASYVLRYDMLSDLKEGGTFLLNSIWSPEEMDKELPASVKNAIAKKNVKFYTLDGLKVVTQLGTTKGVNTVMQAAFFKLANVMPYDQAEEYMKAAIKKTYGKKGDAIVNMNCMAVDNAIKELRQVNYPASWATTTEGAAAVVTTNDTYFKTFIQPVLAQEGDKLPVSALSVNGVVPTGTTKFEKRGIAAYVPEWNIDNCIQCNQCSFVCPHASIRPVLASESTLAGKPETFTTKAALGVKDKSLLYRIQVSPLDCTGCGSCVNVCPTKPEKRALNMVPAEEAIAAQANNWEYAVSLPVIDSGVAANTVKGSQFKQPLFEFSGACAGCGETPYVKLVTQLFGDRMIIANATGCSSIYGGSAPTCPYTTNAQGEGPAWANSLFEDNAEFGYGINLAYAYRRKELTDVVTKAIELGSGIDGVLKAWLDVKNKGEESKAASSAVKTALDGAIAQASGEVKTLLCDIKEKSDCLVKKSVWIFGGDGWAYDIGYGGLDHVLACGEDVNVLVLDTEVYSNTGGQASKATPTGSVAKFAAAGKATKKKDLGMMAMSYGYVYVAQVAMGANQAQVVKALTEAESYDGPSLVIAYSTCINHGIDMSNGQLEMKKAVDAGYWQLYRYDPRKVEAGENGFSLDSKDPTESYQDFIGKEKRYSALSKTNPSAAAQLFERAEKDAKARLDKYKKLADK